MRNCVQSSPFYWVQGKSSNNACAQSKVADGVCSFNKTLYAPFVAQVAGVRDVSFERIHDLVYMTRIFVKYRNLNKCTK